MKITVSFTPAEREHAMRVREVLLQMFDHCRMHTSQVGERSRIYLTVCF